MTRTLGWIAAGLLAALVWAPAATAETGEASAKDLATSTVVIGAQRYRVADNTVMAGAEGEALSLASFPLPREGSRDEVDSVFVQFDSVDTRQGPTLVSLRIVEMPR